MRFSTITDDDWIAGPPKPATYAGNLASWQRRVDFTRRRIHAERQVPTPAPAAPPNDARQRAIAHRADKGRVKGKKLARAQRAQLLGTATPSQLRRVFEAAGRTVDETAVRALLADAERTAEGRATASVFGGPPLGTPAVPRRPGRTGDPYGEGSGFSWLADVLAYRAEQYGAAYFDARRGGDTRQCRRARLARHAVVVGERFRAGDDETRARIAGVLDVEPSRTEERRRSLVEMRDDSATTVAVDLGAFVPPTYLTGQFGIAYSAAAPFFAQTTTRPLPATSLSLTVPVLTTGMTVEAQGDENTTGSAPSSPVAAFRNAPVKTFFGESIVSLQELQRAEVPVDVVLARQCARDAATACEAYLLTEILSSATCGTVASGTTAMTGTDVLAAFSALSKKLSSAVPYLPPTHVALPPAILAGFRALQDSAKRPWNLPQASGLHSTLGAETTTTEGSAGIDFQGMRMFVDPSTALLYDSTAKGYILCGNLREAACLYASEPVCQVIPEFSGAAALSALVRWFRYVSFDLRYPAAFCRISGYSATVTP